MIKKYIKFLEAISGTMDTMPLGPGFPRQQLRNTITDKDTKVVYTDITGKFYTINDYNEIYQNYLKEHPDKPLNGFTKQNLEFILTN